MKIKTRFFSETTRPFITKFHRNAFRNKKVKIDKYELDHMINMTVMPVYGLIIKNKQKKKKKNKQKKKKKNSSPKPMD